VAVKHPLFFLGGLMNELSLFTGAGGILPGHLLGWTPVCAVELERYPREVLLARQRDGYLPAFPIWDDIRSFDAKPWKGLIDVVNGGFPCQDTSSANTKGQGLAGARSSLWFEMLRVIEECEPKFVFAENSPNLRTRGLGTVIEGLTGLGYDVRWCVLGAWHAGFNHRRNRMWIYACHPDRSGQSTLPLHDEVARVPGLASDPDSNEVRHKEQWQAGGRHGIQNSGIAKPSHDGQERYMAGERYAEWWSAESGICRTAHGVGSRMDRLKAIGNGQVPAVAALAWEILNGLE
jgi:DNA (cytosine-5)-methyltransferase 1